MVGQWMSMHNQFSKTIIGTDSRNRACRKSRNEQSFGRMSIVVGRNIDRRVIFYMLAERANMLQPFFLGNVTFLISCSGMSERKGQCGNSPSILKKKRIRSMRRYIGKKCVFSVLKSLGEYF